MISGKRGPTVLICDDDHNLHHAVKTALGGGFDFKSAYHGDEAMAILRKNRIDLVLLDLGLRSANEGLDLIPAIKSAQEDAVIVVYSGRSDLETVKTAMKLGAQDYVLKESPPETLAHVLQQALEVKKLRSRSAQLHHEIRTGLTRNVLLGESPAIERIRKQIERARNSPAPLIIQGETGTGKELVARLLRKTLPDGSPEPFVAIDSGTIQSSVAESILFGYEKGAFTGAEKTTRGLFEEANGGVVYFDEIGNMPLEIQNKLLRVIQEKEVLRIGSARPVPLDFRVICATNRNLEAMVAEGKFKDDLYQRLNVLEIGIPPLRERPDDIPALLEHFSALHANGGDKIRILPETVEQIRAYPFPGNVRELSNLVLHLYTMCEEPIIAPIDLPPRFQAPSGARAPELKNAAAPVAVDLSLTFYEAVEGFERAYLSKAYEKLEGNVSRMSADLRMDRSYLHRKLKNFGIHSAR